jgi:hypothetical protein
MTPSDLLKLKQGLAEKITVCRISNFLASMFGSQTLDVYLSRYTFEKIARDHSDLFPNEIFYLREAIERGLIIQEKEKPHHFTASLQHPEHENKRFIASLKFAKRMHEIWVTSFYRTKKGQTRKKVERGQIIRRHL